MRYQRTRIVIVSLALALVGMSTSADATNVLYLSGQDLATLPAVGRLDEKTIAAIAESSLILIVPAEHSSVIRELAQSETTAWGEAIRQTMSAKLWNSDAVQATANAIVDSICRSALRPDTVSFYADGGIWSSFRWA